MIFWTMLWTIIEYLTFAVWVVLVWEFGKYIYRRMYYTRMYNPELKASIKFRKDDEVEKVCLRKGWLRKK